VFHGLWRANDRSTNHFREHTPAHRHHHNQQKAHMMDTPKQAVPASTTTQDTNDNEMSIYVTRLVPQP
jgi:hypothetical protein